MEKLKGISMTSLYNCNDCCFLLNFKIPVCEKAERQILHDLDDLPYWCPLVKQEEERDKEEEYLEDLHSPLDFNQTI